MKYKIGDEFLSGIFVYEIIDIRGFWIFKKYEIRIKSNIPLLRHASYWVHENTLKRYKSKN